MRRIGLGFVLEIFGRMKWNWNDFNSGKDLEYAFHAKSMGSGRKRKFNRQSWQSLVLKIPAQSFLISFNGTNWWI